MSTGREWDFVLFDHDLSLLLSRLLVWLPFTVKHRSQVKPRLAAARHALTRIASAFVGSQQ
jgi:hypothetical protein